MSNASRRVKIIGVDCATQPENVGLAVGFMENDRTRLMYPQPGTIPPRQGTGASEIVKWMDGDYRVLLAFDAPLGWPCALAPSLTHHQAGEPVRAKADDMFHRETDTAIEERLRVRPLEVGADKIARTAHAALALLNEIRQRRRLPIPLAWSPAKLMEETQVIEVYPAATLRSHGLPHQGYKGKEPSSVKRLQDIIDGLRARIEMPEDVTPARRRPTWF